MTDVVETIRCPGCNNKVLQKAADGTMKLRPKGQVQFKNGYCLLDCYYCKRSLELPLTLEKSQTAPRLRIPLTIPASS